MSLSTVVLCWFKSTKSICSNPGDRWVGLNCQFPHSSRGRGAPPSVTGMLKGGDMVVYLRIRSSANMSNGKSSSRDSWIGLDAVFYRSYTLLYRKFGHTVIFRSGNLYSLCSPGNQHYQKSIYFVERLKLAIKV